MTDNLEIMAEAVNYIFPFKLQKTEAALTAHGGLALLAEFNWVVIRTCKTALIVL